MWMPIPDRFNLGTVARDYWRSIRKFKTGSRDTYALIVLFGMPAGVFFTTLVADYVFPAPVALLPAVALLAGVLLAAAGQIVTLRARISDSLTLSSSDRVRAHVRETMSGVILAAVAALFNALALGALAAATTVPNYMHHWWHTAISSIALMLTTYLALMFVATARRLYATYLEVFEGGAPLRRPTDDRPLPEPTEREATSR